MLSPHSIRAALAAAVLALPLSAAAQQPAPPPQLQEAGAANFTIFLRGVPIGTEQIAVSRTASGWTIVSTGRLGAPIDAVARRLQVRYTPDWKPLEFTLDGTVRGQAQAIHTVVDGTTAKSDITIAGQATQKTDTIDPDALLLLPTNFFGPYEALAVRLKTATVGSDIPVYIEPQSSIVISVGESATEQIQTTGRLVVARRTRVALVLPGGRLDADLWTDETGRMIRFSVPLQSLEVVREDIAAVSSRSVTISRPNDQQLNIPSNGFSLAGTLSRPAHGPGAAPAGRRPRRRQRPDRSRRARRSVFRFSDRLPMPSPTPATSSSATTSAASVRAAAARKPRRSPTTPTMCAPR